MYEGDLAKKKKKMCWRLCFVLTVLVSKELDFLAVVFQLVENEVKKDTEEEKMKTLQQQRDEKKRCVTMK